ncbi:DUF1573 domain-containing protein [Xanthovirga aplysinae]|uniref:DUF1573 domain-containing protein n=1 Tax=Xanthovirga aplysinae TaxID=2529853 RepID=UPI0012BBC568|nr:DUF1573 domain-containing protein [Xanthovirga aplysinae]MTI33358.1 DUF1573 domain-containing protein [Xanthovirga aplysinae]
MKKLLLNVCLLSVIGFFLASCNDNSDLKKRVRNLETKVAKLEEGSSVKVTPSSNRTSTTPTPETTEGPAAKFSFEETSYDFGTIDEGDVVSHTFKFVNEGEVPLVIESARPSCGCTVPHYSKEPVPVGGTGEIQVQFNSKGKPGTRNNSVTVTANTNPKVTRLTFKSSVTPKANAAGPVKK